MLSLVSTELLEVAVQTSVHHEGELSVVLLLSEDSGVVVAQKSFDDEDEMPAVEWLAVVADDSTQV